MKRIAIGCDPNAAELKATLIGHMEELGFEVTDFGSEDPIYANVAVEVAKAVAAGSYDRGVVICGTGIGVSIAANKVPGAYCALCADAYSAERAKKSNNANMIALGAQVTGYQLAKTILTAYLTSEWTPGSRSQPKVQRILELEKELLR